jgi:hypothetical protein
MLSGISRFFSVPSVSAGAVWRGVRFTISARKGRNVYIPE